MKRLSLSDIASLTLSCLRNRPIKA